MVGMRFEGGAALAKAFRDLPDRVSTKVLREALTDAAEPMRASMETTVHRAPGRPDIADHMVIKGITSYKDADLDAMGFDAKIRLEPGSASVAVGPAKGYFWGWMLEFGTVRARAFPFMRPAFDQGAGPALSALAGSMWRALAQAGAGRASSPGGTGGL
jgi:HK97 gp10 family phage protein